MQNNKQVFDEKIFSMLKKIEIPKNPFSFYFNLSKIEKNLSEGLRDYFYKAINEFLYHNKDIGQVNKNHFLSKVYYYTGFMEKIGLEISKLLESLKYYNIIFYLDCINEFDKNIKLKAIIFNIYKNDFNKIKELFDKIKDDFEVKELLQDEKIKKLYNQENIVVFKQFEKNFYSLDYKKNKNLIDFIYENINVNILKYPISYNKTKQDYKTFTEKGGKAYEYYQATNICLDKIVDKYNKNQTFYKNNLIYKIISNVNTIRKNYYIRNLLEKEIISFNKGKKIYHEKYNNKHFEYEYEFENFLITYIINNKHKNLKKYFYWEATKNRLSENEWANIGGANLFYLQKIDQNIGNFELLVFFKQFKDTLIDLHNSLSRPFLKPYFYYVLIFKSIKLQLNDWQKLFFLLMFFSAESYQEYVILQNIMKSIEKIGLWKISIYNSKFLFYLKRFFMIIKEFSSSIILSILLIIGFYKLGLINIIMLGVIFLIMFIFWLKYIFFPGKFEVLRTFGIFSIIILSYVWFTTIFPKITQPQYISYIGGAINSLVSLDFSGTRQNYNKMIKFVYGENYKQNEKTLLANTLNTIGNIKDNVKNNKNIKQITKNTQTLLTSIIKKDDEYIRMRKGTYLKYYINKEIDKLNINFKKKQEISKKVVNKYIKWYCFLHQDKYCKNKLERLPVGFKLNITKIQKFINDSL